MTDVSGIPLEQQRPAAICHSCWVTWRAARPRPPGVYCYHSGTAARPRDDGWQLVEHVSRRELKQLRAEGAV